MSCGAFRKSLFISVSLISPLLLPAGAATAANNNVGWALANQPSTNSIYAPDPKYGFNSSGGLISIAHQGTGIYSVGFANLRNSAPANVQVSAYNTSNWCISHGLSPDTSSKTIFTPVICYDGKGKRVDTPFIVLYQARAGRFGSATKGLAFVTGTSSGVTYTPTTNTFNSAGGTNTITYNSQGNYTVKLPGLTKSTGDLQVTGAVGGGQGLTVPRCKLVDLSSSGDGTNLTVQCYGALGYKENETFSLAYSIGEPLGVAPGFKPLGAWALANNLTSTSIYTPIDQHNDFGTGHLTAQKTGTGTYTVTIPGTLSYTTSTVLVTAVGPGKCLLQCNELDEVGDQCRLLSARRHSHGLKVRRPAANRRLRRGIRVLRLSLMGGDLRRIGRAQLDAIHKTSPGSCSRRARSADNSTPPFTANFRLSLTSQTTTVIPHPRQSLCLRCPRVRGNGAVVVLATVFDKRRKAMPR